MIASLGLAPAVRRAVATEPLEVNRVLHAPAHGSLDRVAGFVGSLGDAKSSPAKWEHLGHERKGLETASVVQRRKDFVCAPYLHPVSGAKSQRVPY